MSLYIQLNTETLALRRPSEPDDLCLFATKVSCFTLLLLNGLVKLPLSFWVTSKIYICLKVVVMIYVFLGQTVKYDIDGTLSEFIMYLHNYCQFDLELLILIFVFYDLRNKTWTSEHCLSGSNIGSLVRSLCDVYLKFSFHTYFLMK